jgi:type IV secretory pathway TraG/TraD family ATPase VirD4
MPPDWGSRPPNHRGFTPYVPDPTISEMIESALLAHRDNYWTVTGLLAFFLLFFTSYAGLGVAVVFLAMGLYYGTQHAANESRSEAAMWKDINRHNYAKQVNAEWDEWLESRPLRRLTKAHKPVELACELVAERGGTTVLGIDATVNQELVLGGRRQNALVVGPTGSAKTLVIASVSVAVHPGPAVFASTKTDNMINTARARSWRGRLWLFDPLHNVSDEELADIEQETNTRIYRVYWSPLMRVRDWDSAKITAKGLIAAARYGPKSNDANHLHWELTAEDLLAPLLMAAALHPSGTMDLVRS